RPATRTPTPRSRSPVPPEQPDRLLQQLGRRRNRLAVEALGHRGDRLVGLAGGPAEADEALPYLGGPGHAGDRKGGVAATAHPVAQLEYQPLGAFLADAGHPGQGGDVTGGDRPAYRVRL